MENNKKLILISNENPIHWIYCAKCGKKLKKDIQKECYWVGCDKCGISYKIDDTKESLNKQIELLKGLCNECSIMVKLHELDEKLKTELAMAMWTPNSTELQIMKEACLQFYCFQLSIEKLLEK